jgi:hypothetical protein
MPTWNSGYTAHIEYTYGYFRELSPALLSLAMLNRATQGNGASAPRYLELGFGQGVSLAIHAAACEGEFWGTDFHPGHAAHAQELVAASGSNAHIFDQSFSEFAARDDLPQFDVIVMHGIWSWVAPEHRETLIALIARRLAVGGILYLSYNAMPGSALMQPVQQLMSLFSRLANGPGTPVQQQIDNAVGFTRAVIDSGAHYFAMNPAVASRFAGVEGHDPRYVAHEYLGEHWYPMSFAEVNALLEDARVAFVGSARLADHLDGLHVAPQGQALLDRIDNQVLRESVRDLMINAQFRADLFMRGGRQMTDLQRYAGYLATRFILTTPVEKVPMTLTTIVGELIFDESIYRPLLAALADDGHAAKTLAMLRSWPGLADKSLESLIQAILVLNSKGHVHPAQPQQVADAVRPRCQALNGALQRQACFRDRIKYLASPVMGAGFPVGWIEQLFLLARSGCMPPEKWPQFVCATVATAGTVLRNEGREVADPEQALAEMTRQAETFQAERLPILQALGIA